MFSLWLGDQNTPKTEYKWLYFHLSKACKGETDDQLLSGCLASTFKHCTVYFANETNVVWSKLLSPALNLMSVSASKFI